MKKHFQINIKNNGTAKQRASEVVRSNSPAQTACAEQCSVPEGSHRAGNGRSVQAVHWLPSQPTVLDPVERWDTVDTVQRNFCDSTICADPVPGVIHRGDTRNTVHRTEQLSRVGSDKALVGLRFLQG